MGDPVTGLDRTATNGGKPVVAPNEQRIPRIALSKSEAAEALGVSVDFLEQHVMHELRIVRCSRRRLIPVSEITRWMESNAHRTLGDGWPVERGAADEPCETA